MNQSKTTVCLTLSLISPPLPPVATVEQQRSDINAAKLQRNTAMVAYCRTAAATLAGVGAGTLGLTGLSGFYFFIAVSLVLSGILYYRVGAQRLHEWFPSRSYVLWNGVLDGLLPFVLIWTLTYGMVHVY